MVSKLLETGRVGKPHVWQASGTPSHARIVCGLLAAFTVAHFAYAAVKFHWTFPPSDFVGQYRNGLIIRQGINPYDPQAFVKARASLFPDDPPPRVQTPNYPPPYYLLFIIPLTYLPLNLAELLWKLLSVTALGVAGYMLMRALLGRWSWEWIALTCLVFLSGRQFLFALRTGSSIFLFLCLLTAVWWAHNDDRQWLAGVLLGASVLFKPIPLMLVPLFLIKRQFKTVVASMAMLGGFIVLSMSVLGSSVAEQWLVGIKAFHTDILYHSHQLSVISLAHKLLGGAHPSLAYGLGAGGLVLLYVVSLLTCARRGGPLCVGQYALVVTLIPISSPYVFPPHLVLLALPLLVALHLLVENEPLPGVRWGVFILIWLVWSLGFYYHRWIDEGGVGMKSLLGHVPLYSALSLWGLLLACVGTRSSDESS